MTLKTCPSLDLLQSFSAIHHHPRSFLSRRAIFTRQSPTLTRPSRRQFVSNTLTPLQTLTAGRILPYPAASLFNLIADISSYPQFIPYCKASTITSHSSPDPVTSQTWPRTADLNIGYGPYDELFRSAVYCLPYTVLEAVVGEAEPTIPRSRLPHYFDSPDSSSSSSSHDPEKSRGNSAIFTSLLTRWTLREYPFKPSPPDGSSPQEGEANKQSASPRTEVNLHIEVRFASAVYSALSQAAAPKLAGLMVEAFEKRAVEVLGEGHGVVEEKRSKEQMAGRSA